MNSDTMEDNVKGSFTNKTKNLLYNFSILTIVALLIIFFTLKYYRDGDFFNSIFFEFIYQIIPEVVAALLTFVVIYWLVDKKGIQLKKTLEKKILGKVTSSEAEIRELKEIINNTDNNIKYVKEKLSITDKLYNLLSNRQNSIQQLLYTVNRTNPFVGKYFTHATEKYFDNFRARDENFIIQGEYQCLIQYIVFWEYIVEEQKMIKLNKNNKKPILVRIVHSNSIDIWTNEDNQYRVFTIELLKLQKQFSDNGGKIVRILLGPEEKPTTKYTETIKLMEQYGIEAKYLPISEYSNKRFDYALLYDERLILKWFSDQIGDGLGEMIIQSDLERKVLTSWAELYYKLQEKGDPITSIPPDREFFEIK